MIEEAGLDEFIPEQDTIAHWSTEDFNTVFAGLKLSLIHISKKHGVTAEEMAEILTHGAFYAGWPNAWAAFKMAKEVYGK